MLEIILESLEELLNIQNVSLTNIDRINLFKSIAKNDYFTRKEYLGSRYFDLVFANELLTHR